MSDKINWKKVKWGAAGFDYTWADMGRMVALKVFFATIAKNRVIYEPDRESQTHPRTA